MTEQGQQLIEETTGKKKKRQLITFRNEPLSVFNLIWDHPIPIEMSITKYCFQGCPYCFATANKRANDDIYGNEQDTTNKFIRLLQKVNGQGYNPRNFIEYCLHKKYPICFSNNVDPFMPLSEKEFKIGERVLTACLEHKQPLYIQTKEVYPNEKVKDLIIQGKDLFHVYVSLSTLDYDIAKKYDTIAVTPQQRIDRMYELSKNGVHVITALNPYVRDWIPDLDKYFKTMKEIGVRSFWCNLLHLTKKQEKVMPKKFEDAIQKADEMEQFFFEDRPIIKEIAARHGIYGHFMHDHSEDILYNGITLWNDSQVWPIDANRFLYKIRELNEEFNAPIYIEWPMVESFFQEHDVWEHIFDVGVIQSVIGSNSSQHQDIRNALGKKNKFKNIVRYIYNNPDIYKIFIAGDMYTFCLIDVDDEDEDETQYIYDDNGDLIYVFDGQGFAKDYYWDQSDEELPIPLTVEFE